MSRDSKAAAILAALALLNVALAIFVNPWSLVLAGFFGVNALERWSPRARRLLNAPIGARR